MQGKTRRSATRLRHSRSFNEAPARMQGKTWFVLFRYSQLFGPSMRPLHECRGKLRFDGGLVCPVIAFNEAPARMQGKTSILRAHMWAVDRLQ